MEFMKTEIESILNKNTNQLGAELLKLASTIKYDYGVSPTVWILEETAHRIQRNNEVHHTCKCCGESATQKYNDEPVCKPCLKLLETPFSLD